MANLTAVLRKTIDGLPSATPQLRAKVYEKARAAITRQIQAANPPLEDHVVQARYRVLEESILESEAHYEALEAQASVERLPSAVAPDPAVEAAQTPHPAADEQAPRDASQMPPEASQASTPRPASPAFPRVTPTLRPAPSSGTGRESGPIRSDTPADEVSDSTELNAPGSVAGPVSPGKNEPEAKVGEVGPADETDRDKFGSASAPAASPSLRPATGAFKGERHDGSPRADSQVSGIPEADMAGPRFAARKPKRRRAPIAAGIAVLALAGLGTAGWFYQDDIRSLIDGQSQVAAVPPVVSTPTTDAGEASAPAGAEGPPVVAVPPSGTPTDTAAPPPAETGGVQPRQFTQRLLPDGNEVDEGPGASVTNAFEEGTDVATASVNAPAATPETVVPVVPPPATPPATAEPAANATVPVGQRAIFYEERSTDREGSQQSGNVVWSVVNEAPADGQPPEPAIRAVADVPNENLTMTMTIRRNADTTLPASHVIEIMFDTPPSFPGGQIENVQRLALKPTEQARGEPLIGVAGKISDGFFIIALNDLQQAVDSNLGLLGREEWIDIPLAYATGQRALMSIEKGIPGSRVFKEALDAWAAKT